jgi:hypothetical protein
MASRAFTPSGGWVIVTDGGLFALNIPEECFQKLLALWVGIGLPDTVAFTIMAHDKIPRSRGRITGRFLMRRAGGAGSAMDHSD